MSAHPETSEPNINPEEEEEQDEPIEKSAKKAHHRIKRKSSGKGIDSLGLEKILANNSKYRATEKRNYKLEDQKLKLAKTEMVLKIKQAEMEEVRTCIGFMEKLKNLGHSTAEIEKFMDDQFSRGEGPSRSPQPSKVQSNNEEDDDSSSGSESD
ncbi:hypothetical protein PtA15_10A488 [Puccinia triticina]|uniref:No apical meristem-associated C-terminal domain-containing protein n=1 Tax=Puccinia triticina TaxID=208348 RepID=A0ABY7CVR6_9BASI|nr:uncharacterized protein PtA15_10A488 [Puccinia triticina]WAQ89065.1 hypothetical protein PtA15_10A488 [Puccinia triticina]